MSEEQKPELVYIPAISVEIRVESKAILMMDRQHTNLVRPIQKHEKEIRQVIAWLNEIVDNRGPE